MNRRAFLTLLGFGAAASVAVSLAALPKLLADPKPAWQSPAMLVGQHMKFWASVPNSDIHRFDLVVIEDSGRFRSDVYLDGERIAFVPHGAYITDLDIVEILKSKGLT